MSEERCAPIIVAADNEEFRTRIGAEIRAEGIEPAIVGDAGAVWKAPPSVVDEGIVVLETDDDVAKLVQMANDLYRSPFHRMGAGGTICVVSQKARDQNQALDWWLIDGHAAIFDLRLRDITGAEVVQVARHFGNSVETWQRKNPPGRLDPVFDRILDRFTDANAWMAAYGLVMGTDGIVMARDETAAALARQAVKLAPENDMAWTKLAHALFYSGRYEEAAEAARRAITINPDGAQAHARLGEALDRLGNRDEPRTEMEKALSMAGDDVALKRWVMMRLEAFDPNRDAR